ncbi:cysteine methyltransferase [Halostagnicola sp. A56]|uniref:methylated-DNA--[protein]-cysteine S-methyltransferase n=1 Tax=Halostagnicola sp. A56 TaxID=1495067 RepID=UPI0004A0D076|nr:methylated-DNA--[protein]-cysteine S-methyltransferase [Halostagnicola sp. A56]KDE60260.1 cysteine methyltransferase [Halostagnicola sp. A56]
MDVPIFKSTIEIDDSKIAAVPATIRAQVAEYERGDRQAFDLEIATPDGILGDVMDAMAEIPYGETRSYGDLAAALETSPIAVGQACGRNPVPILVPCHRVVGSDGSLNGYSAADGVATKRRLLEHEARGQETVQTRLSNDS